MRYLESNSLRQKVEWQLPGAEERVKGEPLFKGDEVSVPQEFWSGVPLPFPNVRLETIKPLGENVGRTLGHISQQDLL